MSLDSGQSPIATLTPFTTALGAKMFGKYGAIGSGLAAAMAIVAGPGTPEAEPWLLPDLRQAPVGCPGGYRADPTACTDWDVCMVADASAPSGDCVVTGPVAAVRLRFTSAEENVGEGPLLLYANRDSVKTPRMTVRQAFQSAEDGSIPGAFATAQRAAGTQAYYEPALSHRHWHLLEFERFQLRTPEGATVLVDRKNGFCLGDRYTVDDAGDLVAWPPRGGAAGVAKYLRRNRCGHHQPLALDVAFGISVGSGDDYRRHVDFQWLDLTGVPSGVYDVVNTVNEDRALLEKSYTNNSSSIAIALQWPEGAHFAPDVITAPPEVRLLRSCPGRSHCAKNR